MQEFNLGGGHLPSPKGVVTKAMMSGLIPRWPHHFRGVQVPAPTISPTDVSVEDLSKHLSEIFKIAWKWTWGGGSDELKEQYWKCLGVMRKAEYALPRKMKAALRELKDGGSNLSLMLYAWWQMQRAKDKGLSSCAPQSVFDPVRLTNAQHRGFFWRDCGDVLKVMPAVWTKASEEAHDLLAEVKGYDAYFEDVEEVVSLWKWWGYAREMKLITFEHERQYARIRDAVDKRVWAYDLGLWVASDLCQYLKIKDICSERLK